MLFKARQTAYRLALVVSTWASTVAGQTQPPIPMQAGPMQPGPPPPGPLPGRPPAIGTAPAGGQPSPQSEGPRLEWGGYVRPAFGLRVQEDDLKRNDLDYGFFGVAGLSVKAQPFQYWKALLKLEFDARGIENVAVDLRTFDTNKNGDIDSVSYSQRDIVGMTVPEASIVFEPQNWVQLRAGVTRIPFTLQQQSTNAGTLFPTRSLPGQVFLSGSDVGVLARATLKKGFFVTSLGVFNGSSLGLRTQDVEPRGLVFAYRADLQPFGAFVSYGEGDLKRGPFRAGVGAGVMFEPATRSGTEAHQLFDLRFSASLRMAYRGLYVVAEYFRRQQVDDFSSRPEVADGAYAQVAFFARLTSRLGIEPMARIGFVARDETFDTRLAGYAAAGLNFYPMTHLDRPDSVKLTAHYVGERRFTERENAHGMVAAAQLLF